MLTDKKIGVIMGGISSEREISLKSGRAVFEALKSRGYNVISIEIAPEVPHSLVSPQQSADVICTSSQICDALKRKMIDIAFLTLHGGYGENGAVQGLLEVMGITYTGSGVLASAIAMDKEASKKIFAYHKIPVPQFFVIFAPEKQAGNTQASGAAMLPRTYNLPQIPFSMPWVVKPATEGSSIGISIVREESSLKPALEKAFGFSSRVIVEEYIKGRELQTGILNKRILGTVEVRPKIEFYNYEAKYTPGLTEYILPPDMPPDVISRAEQAALSANEAIGCSGATRVDLIIDNSGKPFVLEVNTIPGMTETSLLPKIAKLSGIDLPSLAEEMLREVIIGKNET